MTDYTKLIERLRELQGVIAKGGITRLSDSQTVCEATDAIEALQAENERLKRDVACHDDMSNEIAYLRKERDALQAELQRQEPVIDFTVLHQFASDQAISYNKLCTAVRMCLAAPANGIGGTP